MSPESSQLEAGIKFDPDTMKVVDITHKDSLTGKLVKAYNDNTVGKVMSTGFRTNQPQVDFNVSVNMGRSIVDIEFSKIEGIVVNK